MFLCCINLKKLTQDRLKQSSLVLVGTCLAEKRETLAGAQSATRDNEGHLHTLSSALDKEKGDYLKRLCAFFALCNVCVRV